MEIRVLTYFLTVAREENITRAAKLLHITQPTLSRQMMQLEEELGVKLFTRSNHSIVLTDAGMLLRRRAQEIVTLADKTAREFAQDTEEISGEICFGCGELNSMNGLAEVMADFKKLYPRVHFDVYSANADDIKERMARGFIDISLFAEPVDVLRYDFFRLSEKEDWGIYVHQNHALAQKEFVTPKDLAGVPLLFTKRALVQNEINNWFGEYADDMNVAATFNLTYNAAVMAKHHIGAVFGIRLENCYAELKFVPLKPNMQTGSVIAWKKLQTYAPAPAAFIRFLKEYEK